MNTLKPIIKFNGGDPIALCKRCFIIMCYVSCSSEEQDMRDDIKCIVRSPNGDSINLYTTIPVGDPAPTYCDKCKELLNYSVNE